MNRWDERSIRDDLNKASKGEEQTKSRSDSAPESIKDDFNAAAGGDKPTEDEYDKPQLNFDPPGKSGPAPGGAGGGPAWDRHPTNNGTKAPPSRDKQKSDDGRLTQAFNKAAKP